MNIWLNICKFRNFFIDFIKIRSIMLDVEHFFREVIYVPDGNCMQRKFFRELGITAHVIQREMSGYIRYDEMKNSSNANWYILVYLYENRDKEIFQRDIEKEFSVRRSTVSKVLALMEKKGQIVREKIDRDARLKLIRLSEKMEKFIEKMNVEGEKFQKIALSDIQNDELEIFYKVLNKVRENILLKSDSMKGEQQ